MGELAPPLPQPDPEDLVRELEREERNITRDLIDGEQRRPLIREKLRAELLLRLGVVDPGHDNRVGLHPVVGGDDRRPDVVLPGVGERHHDDDPRHERGAAPATREERVAFVLARPQAGVRELARELGVAPSTVTRIRRKHATPDATPAETPIATAVAQSEAMAAATTIVADAPAHGAAEQIAEHQRRLAGVDPPAKGIAPVPQPRLFYIEQPRTGEEPVNVGTYDLSRDRIETGPLSQGRRGRKPPKNPFTPYAPNNA